MAESVPVLVICLILVAAMGIVALGWMPPSDMRNVYPRVNEAGSDGAGINVRGA